MRFLIASQHGDIEVDQSILAFPYKTALSEAHSFLTLGDWFSAAESFLLKTLGQGDIPLTPSEDCPLPCQAPNEVVIRSEKHGALYHVASIEYRSEKGLARYCLLSTLASSAGKWLVREFETLAALGKAFPLEYLPRALLLGSEHIDRYGRHERFVFALTEWFDGYHEWHIAGKDGEGKDIIRIWEGRGRLAKEHEAHGIYRQASRILTNYFNPETLCQIRPWHHAAGDFVVRLRKSAVDVKLCSARGYAPSSLFPKGIPKNPWTGLVFFMLELSVRMRLDKIEGTGDSIWASASSLPAIVMGFFEGLIDKEKRKEITGLSPGAFLNLARGFTKAEYVSLLQSIKAVLSHEDPSDCVRFSENLESHAEELLNAFKSYRPEDTPGAF